jgi:C1A family cysteine protease/predicted secreted protein
MLTLGVGPGTRSWRKGWWAVALLVPLLAGALLLASSAQSSSPPPPVEIVIDSEHEGGEVQLHEGETLVIRLESNPSTGYGWEVAQPLLSSDSLPVLRQTGDEYQPCEESGPSYAEGDGPLLGAPMTQVLRFQALRAGQTSLDLVYRRPWEDVPPLDSFSIEVEAVGSFSEASLEASETEQGASVAAASETATLGDDGDLGLPLAFNWCDQGACTPVKNQSTCGSCWAFSTVGPLESNILYYDGLVKDLSEQYLLSCNTDGWSCDGGNFAHDYHEWKKPPGEPDAGAVYETDFPYTAQDDPCYPPHDHHEKIVDWDYVGNNHSVPSVANIKQAILDYGPVSVAICIGSAFRSYPGGIFDTSECTNPNHAVVLVGWDDEQGDNGVWYLRNSWGGSWGESGYMRIEYGTSAVGYAANYIVYQTCYDLDLNADPAGSGGIVADPLPNCGGGYESDTVVELTANANPGWHFHAWGEDASGSTNPITITMDSNKSVTAYFVCDGCSTRARFPVALKNFEHQPTGWLTIISEDFEGSFPGSWVVADNQAGYGEYYWGRRGCRAFGGSYSGWAVGAGSDGSSLACGSNYPNYVDSWMVYGPFSLQSASAADLQLKLWLNSESGDDYFFWGASTDGGSFYGLGVSGYSGGWVDRELDLSDVYTLGNLLGEPEVWIALVFQSDSGTNYPEGAYVDNVALRKYVMTAGQPAPSPAPASCTTCGTELEERPAVMIRSK